MPTVSVSMRFISQVLLLCAVLAVDVAPASAQVTQFVFYGSGPSSISGLNTGWVMATSADSDFTAKAVGGFGVSVRVVPKSYVGSGTFSGNEPPVWEFAFVAPFDLPLMPETYRDPQELLWPSVSRLPQPQVRIRKGWSECDVVGGHFTIVEVEYDSTGVLSRLSANFQFQCRNHEALIAGALRFNASPRPAQPVTVTTVNMGSVAVTSIPAGLSCGATCSSSLEDGRFFLLQHAPPSGTGFRWGGDDDCSDGIIFGGRAVSCTLTYEPCRITVQPTSVTVPADVATLPLLYVSANGPDCRWQHDSAVPWIWSTWPRTPSRGSRTLVVQATAHTSSWRPRTGTVTVAGQTVTVTQLGPEATYDVPSMLEVGPGSGTTNFVFTSNVSDPPWTATSESAWISTPASGLSTVVPVTVTRNLSFDTPRLGTIVVAGRTVQIVQRPNTVPGEPTALSVRVVNGVARFTWRAPTEEGDATSYRIEAGLERGATAVVFQSAGTSFDLSGIPDGRFFVRVRGINESGVGVASDDYELDVRGGVNPPDPPVAVTLNMTSTLLDLSWTEAEGGGVADGYVLEVGSRAGFADVGRFALGRTTRFQFANPPRGYFVFTLRAVNRAGTSRASEQRGYRLELTGLWTYQMSLAAAVSAGTVTFRWSPAWSRSYPTAVRLAVGRAPGVTEFVVDSIRERPLLSFSGVPPGRYYARVQELYGIGIDIGPASNEVYVHVR